MDPKDKEIADLKAANATLTTQVETVTKERDAAVGDVTKLGADLKKKDEIIDQKNKDIVGARKEYKKLSEMSQEEKDKLSAAELQLQERQEKLEKDQADFQAQQLEATKKETDSRRTGIFNKLVGSKPELVKKMEENWGKLDKGLTEKATTPEEIEKLAGDAFNMLGAIKPDAVRAAVSTGGNGEAGNGAATDFSETAEGKALASALGVNIEPPKAAPAVK